MHSQNKYMINNLNMSLTKEQQKSLLKLARNVIGVELGLEAKNLTKNNFSDPIFNEKRGVFVTLEINKNLRGCIGNIEPVYSLIEGVERNAYEAAFGDPRFNSLEKDEFPLITIEISILTVPEKLSYDSSEDLLKKLIPNKHGVVLQQGMYKATYLPQVWESLSNKEEFLSSLCMKAGLDPDDWKDPETEILIYEVEKFIEA